ncbi:MAG: hypothetical protein B7C24_03970 [Bacteroidetes bacterium 4572_77]|nr:MAG: hypothetical protein B7C24_03970 [Bacteroidetes bacterium 4572_77]
MNSKPTYQERLENENKQLKATMDSVDAIIYVADMQTHELLFLNKLGEQYLGDKIGDKCYSVLQNGKTEACEFCTNHLLLNKNGEAKEPHVWEFQNTITKRWYQCRDQAIEWTDGRLVRIEIATDITDRKKIEQALVESDNQLREAQRIAKLGYWKLDIVKDKLFWSDEVYRIFDLKPQDFEATFEAFLNKVHPEDRKRVEEAYTSSLRNKTSYKIEHRLLLANTGEIKYVLEQCKTEYDNSGNPLYSFGTVLDITERKIMEEVIKKEIFRFRSIFDANPAGVYIVDKEYNIEYANAAIKKDFGELNGQKCYRYFHELSEPCKWCKNKEVFAGKTVNIF